MHLTVPIIYSGALIIYVKCKFYSYFYKFYTRKEIIALEYKLLLKFSFFFFFWVIMLKFS